jgi:hypothetical protein
MVRRLAPAALALLSGCIDFDTRITECQAGRGLCSDGGDVVCTSGTNCGGHCVDTTTDQSSCGMCGHACAGSDRCFGGQCRGQNCADSTCGPGKVCVEGTCTETACLTVLCGLGTTCVSGACVTRACSSGTCASGTACLDGGCVDVGCQGVTCLDGGQCDIGRCDGRINCFNNQVDPNESDLDCGGVCTPCVDGKHCRIPQDCASTRCGDAGICLPTCANGATCGTNPGSPCKAGVKQCTSTDETCVDGQNAADGQPCGAQQLCSNGACVTCIAGQSCTTNPDPCKAGLTACTGTPSCNNGSAKDAGSDCGTGEFCTAAGVCNECAAGAPCSSNISAPCKLGVVSCATGVERCVDDVNADTGTSCGVDKICQSGACIGCAAGAVCSTNLNQPCKAGVTACGATPGCMDGTNMPGGAPCGSGQVCNGNGQCLNCQGGQPCSTNPGAPCKSGITSCATGMSVCMDSNAATAGIDCGTNQVCNGSGACVSCVADAGCTTNPNTDCHAGVTSCGTGAQACVDGAPKLAGTGCGASQVCDMNGFCGVCMAGNACTGNPNPCKTGTTTCSSGNTVCSDGMNRQAGASCGTNQVCDGTATCVACTAGLACTANPNPCFTGKTSCATGAQTCVNDTQQAPGTSCGLNQVCDPSGTCNACTASLACMTNPNPCKTGITSCATGTSACIDYGDRSGGTSCGANLVCDGAGSCVSCVASQACGGNPNVCFDGVTSCATGAQVCTDGTKKATGTACGMNQVCNGSGQCVACTAGLACGTNPNSACATGVTSCTTGATTCVDSTLRPAGTPCGTNLVCTAAGVCSSCTAGTACTTNPSQALCLNGVTSCSTGSSICVDGAPKAAGTSCGSGLVCDSGGSCGACTAGQACFTNPNAACFAGVTSCATGTTTCVDGTARGAGSSCGTNLVCNGMNQCVSCTANLSCSTNPNQCKTGVTSCATGASVCVDSTDKAPGTVCGTNQVCNAGSCVACTASQSCTTNPSSGCYNGTTSCASGSSVCVDGTQKAPGTGCGTNQVCSPSGMCVACTAGSACSTNPNALCATGLTSCTTGAQTCIDSTPRSPGTSCGSNMVCNASAVCSPCTSGGTCTGNPNNCKNGITSCATGAQACVDGSNVSGGTTCGTNKVCDGNGFCGDCTANQSCTGNPGACFNGTTSCATGTTTCVNGTAKMTGTSCGTNLVCNAAHSCVSCTANQSCTGNPTPCKNGLTTCSTGAQTCVDNTTFRPVGTACGAGHICDGAGTCVACTSGTACNTNPNAACFDGVTSCSTGMQTCVDAAQKPPGTTCGSSLVCSASGTCVACMVGSGYCEQNPTFCVNGTFSTCSPPTCVDRTTGLPQIRFKPQGTSCDDFGDVCDGAGSCGQFQCVGQPDGTCCSTTVGTSGCGVCQGGSCNPTQGCAC